MFSIKPLPLFIIRSKKDQQQEEGDKPDAAEGEESKAEEGSEKAAEDAPKKEEEPKKPDASMQSGISMTMTETSEDAT